LFECGVGALCVHEDSDKDASFGANEAKEQAIIYSIA
jgi:hypothetical protein